TLEEIEGILYAAFPKVRGRTLDETDAEGLRRIGRLVGRMHAIGAARDAPHRPRLTVERYVHEPLETPRPGGVSPRPAPGPRPDGRYRDAAPRRADIAAPPLARARTQRIHGDLHWGNVLWPADPPILLDFDDFLVGPPVQDLWLLARGGSEEARKAREQLVE